MGETLPIFPDSEPGHRLGDVERWAAARGVRVLAGIDEAGRGPLAGPVVAACVVLPDEAADALPGLDDSKRLTASARERLYDLVLGVARAAAVAAASHSEIDELNILQATRLAMRRALEAVVRTLAPEAPDLVLVDGNRPIETELPQRTIVRGDGRSLHIAAASVLAKVSRDRTLAELDERYPGYGFAAHKGYPTKAHRDAIRRLGPCAVHRRSFRLL